MGFFSTKSTSDGQLEDLEKKLAAYEAAELEIRDDPLGNTKLPMSKEEYGQAITQFRQILAEEEGISALTGTEIPASIQTHMDSSRGQSR